jgi:hypothetical protein
VVPKSKPVMQVIDLSSYFEARWERWVRQRRPPRRGAVRPCASAHRCLSPASISRQPLRRRRPCRYLVVVVASPCAVRGCGQGGPRPSVRSPTYSTRRRHRRESSGGRFCSMSKVRLSLTSILSDVRDVTEGDVVGVVRSKEALLSS